MRARRAAVKVSVTPLTRHPSLEGVDSAGGAAAAVEGEVSGTAQLAAMCAARLPDPSRDVDPPSPAASPGMCTTFVDYR